MHLSTTTCSSVDSIGLLRIFSFPLHMHTEPKQLVNPVHVFSALGRSCSLEVHAAWAFAVDQYASKAYMYALHRHPRTVMVSLRDGLHFCITVFG